MTNYATSISTKILFETPYLRGLKVRSIRKSWTLDYHLVITSSAIQCIRREIVMVLMVRWMFVLKWEEDGKTSEFVLKVKCPAASTARLSGLRCRNTWRCRFWRYCSHTHRNETWEITVWAPRTSVSGYYVSAPPAYMYLTTAQI